MKEKRQVSRKKFKGMREGTEEKKGRNVYQDENFFIIIIIKGREK